MAESLAEAALRYAARSIAVFPLQHREKIPPKFFKWREEASAELGRVRSWWRVQPGANIGLPTGPTAGFWVFDIDGEDGAAALAALEAQHGALPATPEQTTGKGRHICFAWDPSRPVRNRARMMAHGLDARGEGGYIVAAPSVHPSGRQYAWVEGRSLEDLPLARPPAWLMDLVVPPPESPKPRPVTRVLSEGRSTRYGEAALTRACRDIAAARKGTRDTTLYRNSCQIGCLVAGGQIECAYATQALLSAGFAHVPDAYTTAQLERQVERGLLWGSDHPHTPADRGAPRAPAVPLADPLSAGELWAQGRPIIGTPAEVMLRRQGLEVDRSGMGLRYHPAAAIAGLGDTACMPAILAQLSTVAGPVGGLHVIWFDDRGRTRRRTLGREVDEAGRPGAMGLLHPIKPGPLVVAHGLENALAAAQLLGEPCALAATPSLWALQGGWMGDAYGRVNPDLPRGDPARPPYLMPGAWTEVVIAVDRNLAPETVPARKAAGGTWQRPLEPDDRARICAALATQAWRRACPDLPANAVRTAAPSAGRSWVDELQARREVRP
jgi:hypothetical protein